VAVDAVTGAAADRCAPARSLLLEEFAPRPELLLPATEVTRPRFPVVDAHNHLGAEFGGGWDRRPEWANDLPQRLCGMFAFAIWDSRHRSLGLHLTL